MLHLSTVAMDGTCCINMTLDALITVCGYRTVPMRYSTYCGTSRSSVVRERPFGVMEDASALCYHFTFNKHKSHAGDPSLLRPTSDSESRKRATTTCGFSHKKHGKCHEPAAVLCLQCNAGAEEDRVWCAKHDELIHDSEAAAEEMNDHARLPLNSDEARNVLLNYRPPKATTDELRRFVQQDKMNILCNVPNDHLEDGPKLMAGFAGIRERENVQVSSVHWLCEVAHGRSRRRLLASPVRAGLASHTCSDCL